jgi:hypothetical protein
MHSGLLRQGAPSVLALYRETLGWNLGYVATDAAPELAPDEREITPLPEDVSDDIARSPERVIACNCARFDAVRMPSHVGQALLTACEEGPQVPAFVIPEADMVVVLVEPGSGSALAAESDCVIVHTGSRSWITVPPSPGMHWDTPPWTYASHRCIPLPNGARLAAKLHKVQRVLNRSRTRSPDSATTSNPPTSSMAGNSPCVQPVDITGPFTATNLP